MGFVEVGQEILTPRGSAKVVSDVVGQDFAGGEYIFTTRGMFPANECSFVGVDRTVTRSLDSLEAWLEDGEPPPPGSGYRSEQVLCGCPCGQKGQCYRIRVVNVGNVVTMRNHLQTMACGCDGSDCACI